MRTRLDSRREEKPRLNEGKMCNNQSEGGSAIGAADLSKGGHSAQYIKTPMTLTIDSSTKVGGTTQTHD